MIIEYLDIEIPVYDITVEDTHCFFANDILVHNCAEIAIPTKDIGGDDPEIGLCTLSAIVVDETLTIDDIKDACYVLVRALDNLLDYQEYPVKEALKAKQRRSLGIGITNFAGFLAGNFTKYGEDYALKLTHELMETIQYYLISASVDLAKEKGPCDFYKDTNWSKGLLPIDWYNKRVDELVEPTYKHDWETLRTKLIKYGIRNSTLSALMPCESSSQVSNSSNGIEPPKAPVVIKASKDGSFSQLIRDPMLSDEYTYTWTDIAKNNKLYLAHVAVLQKFVDQSISANTYYDPSNYESGNISLTDVLDDLIYAWSYGIKTMYYHNTRDQAEEVEFETESDCESCKL